MVGDEDAVPLRNAGDLLTNPAVQPLQLRLVALGVLVVGTGVLGIQRAQRLLDIVDPDQDIVRIEPEVGISLAFMVMTVVIVVLVLSMMGVHLEGQQLDAGGDRDEGDVTRALQ